MSTPEEIDAADRQAEMIARHLSELQLQDPRYRLFMREVVLQVTLEQLRQREQTALQTFFSACAARGIKLRMDDNDAIKVNDVSLFTAELKAVYMMYRGAIVGALAKERDEKRLVKRA